MSTTSHAAERPHVAVGATRPAAAAVFGQDHDQLDLTDYTAFTTGPAPSTYASVSIAAGDGQGPVLALVCDSIAGPDAPDVVLEYPADVPGRTAVREVLTGHPTIAVTAVWASRGSMLIGLAGTRAGTDPPPHAALLQALDLLPANSATTAGSEPKTQVDAPTAGRPATDPLSVRILGRVSRLSGATGRRGRLLTLMALGLIAVVVLIILTLIGTSPLGAPGVMVALLVLTLAVVGVVGGTLMVALAEVQGRQRDQQALQRRTRGLLERRTTRILEQYRSPELRNPDLAAIRRYAAEIASENAKSVVRQQQQHLDTQRQLQAALNVLQLVRLDAAVPAPGGAEAYPDLNLLIMDILLQRRPATTVLVGSSTSTLFLALTAAQHDLDTRIVMLEHDARAQASTRALLARHGVTDHAEVRMTPSVSSDVEGPDAPQRDDSELADLDQIGVLVVDIGARGAAHHPHFDAVPQLREKLAASCTVVLAGEDDESGPELAQLWSQLLPDFTFEVVGTAPRKVGLLTRESP